MAIAITSETNVQLYRNAVAIAKDLLDIANRCQVFAEQLYAIGIPDDPANGGSTAVTGFEDAANLNKADLAAAIGLALDTKNYLLHADNLGRYQVVAKLLRNENL